MKTPFLGGSYVAYSQNLAANRLVNLYPEKAQDGGKSIAAFFRTPGLDTVVEIGAGPIRGGRVIGSFLYLASGSKLYKVSTGYSATELGDITGSGPVSMADNGTQLFVACNPNGYIYNTSTEVFAQITDADFPGAQIVDYIDGYFIFTEPDTQKFWITSFLDGTAIDPLDFFSAEGSPDNIRSLVVDHREVWLFGDLSSEVWYNTGDADSPFTRNQSAFIEHGCAATFSVAKMDNSVFWLGKDDKGEGIVWRANQYTPQRISTHAIENAINGYSIISDATAYTYQEQGHTFYVLTFPTGNATWVFDAATGLWHERAYRNPELNTLGRHRSSCHVFFNRKHIVGDYIDGRVYRQALDLYDDDGDPLVWLRSWRALPSGSGFGRTYHHRLQVDAEVGIGLVTGQGSNPQMMLRFSDDGGYNWGNEHWTTMGAVGQRRVRAIFRRLGFSRDRVYEVSGSDPVKIALVDADLEYSSEVKAA